MCQSTLIFTVHDFTATTTWKGALQLKAMFAELERQETAVFMTSPTNKNLTHA